MLTDVPFLAMSVFMYVCMYVCMYVYVIQAVNERHWRDKAQAAKKKIEIAEAEQRYIHTYMYICFHNIFIILHISKSSFF